MTLAEIGIWENYEAITKPNQGLATLDVGVFFFLVAYNELTIITSGQVPLLLLLLISYFLVIQL